MFFKFLHFIIIILVSLLNSSLSLIEITSEIEVEETVNRSVQNIFDGLPRLRKYISTNRYGLAPDCFKNLSKITVETNNYEGPMPNWESQTNALTECSPMKIC